jgi:Cdc6-like AAA superfamily ATPase
MRFFIAVISSITGLLTHTLYANADIVHASISRAEFNIATIHSKLTKGEELEALNWLTRIEYGSQQSAYLNQRQPGTGEWFLESAEYQDWRETDKKTLLLSGIPGAGKTILTAIVIDNLTAQCLTNHSVGLAYIYCDFRQKSDQKAEDLLSSVLKQLSQCQSSLPTSVKELYERHKHRRTRPSLNELFKSLQAVAESYAKVFVVIDALDECETSDDCRNVFLSRIFGLQKICFVKILATTRPIPEITEKFMDGRLEIRAHESDVRKYIEGRILQSGSEFLKTYEHEIKSGIMEAVDGM